MDKPMRDPEERRRIANQAAEWLFRLEAGSPEERRAFVRWLRSSKDAADEVLLAKSTEIVLRQLLRERPINLADLNADENNVLPLPISAERARDDESLAAGLGREEASLTPCASADSGEGRSPSNPEHPTLLREKFRTRAKALSPWERVRAKTSSVSLRARERQKARWRRAWIASLSTGAMAGLAILIFQPAFVRDWLHPNVYTTSVGEQRAIELVDGSAISINAASSMRVKYSQGARDVYLDSGQAMFSVAKDAARPFRVHVGNSVVQAIGTKFDVRRRADRINVAVVEGTVQITSEPRAMRDEPGLAALAASTRVTAGEGVSVADTGRITAPATISVAEVSAWQQRRLIFSDNTLAEITEEFARFNRRPHLRVESEALRARRFSGVFDADAPEALLVYLAADETIAFERRGDEIVIMPRPIIVQSDVENP